MDTFACKYEDKKTFKSMNGGGSLMNTPTMTSGKMKKKRKQQLQSST